MSFSNFEEMDEKEFPKLDMQAKNNRTMKEKKLSMFKNKVRWAANFHNYVNEAKITSIAELACDNHYQTAAFFSAMGKIASDYDKFPSFKVITELTNSYTKDKKEDINNPIEWAIKQQETRDYLEIKKQFINLLGEDKLDSFTKWWLKNTFPDLSSDILASMNLNTNYFERCALFDWSDTGRTNKFERIIDTSKRKMEELRKRHSKNIRKTERVR